MKERNSGKKASIAASSGELREQIGHQLKAYYDDLATPMPHHVAELAEKLVQRIDQQTDKAEET